MIGEREGEAEERGEHAEHERHQTTTSTTLPLHHQTNRNTSLHSGNRPYNKEHSMRRKALQKLRLSMKPDQRPYKNKYKCKAKVIGKCDDPKVAELFLRLQINKSSNKTNANK